MTWLGICCRERSLRLTLIGLWMRRIHDRGVCGLRKLFTSLLSSIEEMMTSFSGSDRLIVPERWLLPNAGSFLLLLLLFQPSEALRPHKQGGRPTCLRAFSPLYPIWPTCCFGDDFCFPLVEIPDGLHCGLSDLCPHCYYTPFSDSCYALASISQNM